MFFIAPTMLGDSHWTTSMFQLPPFLLKLAAPDRLKTKIKKHKRVILGGEKLPDWGGGGKFTQHPFTLEEWVK